MQAAGLELLCRAILGFFMHADAVVFRAFANQVGCKVRSGIPASS